MVGFESMYILCSQQALMARNLTSSRKRVLSEGPLHETDIASTTLNKQTNKRLEKMLPITVWVMIPRDSLVTGS